MKLNNNNNMNHKYKNKNVLIKTFDGIRKDNSRIIFISLLIVIIMDCVLECIV